MPRHYMFTREQVLDAALTLTRQRGIGALTARALGEQLGTSPKPIFSHFDSMEAVQAAVSQAAAQEYSRRIETAMHAGAYPPYKASGMAYIQFAREEKELFKLIFMCDRGGESSGEDRESIRPLLELIQRNLGISEDEAYLFHLEMWLYVHGIATMLATSYLDWDESFVSSALTDAYAGLKHRFMEERNNACN